MADSSSSLTIVAIPSQDDYVWKISSEKVPHMTLLFLGDQSNNPNVDHMIEYLGHVASTSMNQFGLSVERRGLLGPKDADVLFFENDYCVKMINQTRGYLLQDKYIKQAYDSVEQYPSWTPHMTLGYPETPAKPDNRDYPGFNWVNFDRIAIWTGDYEGPTFELEKKNYDMELSMSEQLNEFLEHHGVDGQKWGVRRDRSHEGQRAKNSKIARLDKKFEKRAGNFGTELTIYNQAARRMNEFEVDRINRKPEYRNADLRGDTPLSRKYDREMQSAFMKHLKEAAADVGTNASGTKKLDVRTTSDGGWEVTVADIKHADGDGTFKVNVTRDKTGHITSIAIVADSFDAASSRDIVDVMGQSENLSHFGVKGMKWGARRAEKRRAASSEDSNAAADAKAKVKKAKGTHVLTNKELQSLVTRLNLEQQFTRLQENQPKKITKGKNFAKGLIETGRMANDVVQLVNSPAAKIVRDQLIKR